SARPRLGGNVLEWLSVDGKKLLATRILRTFAYGYLAVVLGLYLDRLGMSPIEIGLVFTAAIAGSAVMTVFWSIVADRYGRLRTVWPHRPGEPRHLRDALGSRRARPRRRRAALHRHPPLGGDGRQARGTLRARRIRGWLRRAVRRRLLVLPALGVRSGDARGDLLLGRHPLRPLAPRRRLARRAHRPP